MLTARHLRSADRRLVIDVAARLPRRHESGAWAQPAFSGRPAGTEYHPCATLLAAGIERITRTKKHATRLQKNRTTNMPNMPPGKNLSSAGCLTPESGCKPASSLISTDY